jgi:hypothetical protein
LLDAGKRERIRGDTGLRAMGRQRERGVGEHKEEPGFRFVGSGRVAGWGIHKVAMGGRSVLGWREETMWIGKGLWMMEGAAG